jgi:hypothetical protein
VAVEEAVTKAGVVTQLVEAAEEVLAELSLQKLLFLLVL